MSAKLPTARLLSLVSTLRAWRLPDMIETVLARHASGVTRASEEPDVVVVPGVGSMWGMVGEDGRAYLFAVSATELNESGTPKQRIATVDDPSSAKDIEIAIRDAYLVVLC